jgi:hypothetical protein
MPFVAGCAARRAARVPGSGSRKGHRTTGAHRPALQVRQVVQTPARPQEQHDGAAALELAGEEHDAVDGR